MESYLPLGGFQLPFQRRLSRLYNDTKKSSDFVKEPVSEDPEIKAMHRKLKIQKDRLVSWGLEWSDPSNQAAEIDESLSKAGLSDLVGSIMSTIKDILAEAEPLWLSSKRRIGTEKEAEKATGDKKVPFVVWDKTRFDDLIKDLTASIDTLHDLSRTRSTAATSNRLTRLSKPASSSEELRPFGSTRIQTPQVIDPLTLTNLKSMQATPVSDVVSSQKRPQEVVFMSKQAYSDLTHRPGRQPWSPLLLEFAEFDPIYSSTGIMPSMSRFEKLSSGLQTESHRSPGAWIGLPLLLGYFEDMERSRLGLVYQLPPSFNPVSFEHLTQNPIDNLCTLSELLSRPNFEPRLEAKYRLAHNLANTIFDLHARGITHGNLLDSTVSFCNPAGNEMGMRAGEVDIRRPLVSSFDVFTDDAPQSSSTTSTFWRHPLDPRTTPTSPLASNKESKTLDLYALALLLVSIGLWTKLDNLVIDPASPNIPEFVLEQLAVRCGTLYMKAVQSCWSAVDQELARPGSANEILSQVQIRASRCLEACCILDGVSDLDERLSEDIGDVSSSERQPSLSVSIPSLPGSSSAEAKQQSALSATATPFGYEKRPDLPLSASETTLKQSIRPTVSTPKAQDTKLANLSAKPIETPTKLQAPKTRLYPHIPLPPDAIDRWNNTVMPQINLALRHFYRKNLESVEISLESIGESPQKTTPTVLVVCTSVNKVRAILKKKLGMLFDGTSGLGLKVCRGSVLRSRKGGNTRSMAKGSSDDGEDAELPAANPDFQERPLNGASIGAWIGDRHLPPVSFGGLIVVDDKTYGMTVHHMLDDPDQAQGPLLDTKGTPALRSSAAAQDMSYMLESDSAGESSGGEDFACEFSDTDSEDSATDITSDYEDEDEDEEDSDYAEPGDIPGVEPGCGDGYVITQPALDDVEEGFYPSEDTMDEDHLVTFRLGEIYASSGIRRRHDPSGLIHEIDWALFEFNDDRLPDENHVPHIQYPEQSSTSSSLGAHLQPITVAPTSSLPGLEVQCIARTSGLQTGLILPSLTSVKIYGRASPSHAYQVSGRAVTKDSQPQPEKAAIALPKMQSVPGIALGIPGDSGAWVIDRRQGQLCGHVLAWSERKQVAYICPMDVLLLDIAETLEAGEVRLPGGEPVVERQEADVEDSGDDLGDLLEEEDDEQVPQLKEDVRSLTRDMGRTHLKTGVVSG